VKVDILEVSKNKKDKPRENCDRKGSPGSLGGAAIENQAPPFITNCRALEHLIKFSL
jgi:hypothetical protein